MKFSRLFLLTLLLGLFTHCNQENFQPELADEASAEITMVSPEDGEINFQVLANVITFENANDYFTTRYNLGKDKTQILNKLPNHFSSLRRVIDTSLAHYIANGELIEGTEKYFAMTNTEEEGIHVKIDYPFYGMSYLLDEEGVLRIGNNHYLFEPHRVISGMGLSKEDLLTLAASKTEHPNLFIAPVKSNEVELNSIEFRDDPPQVFGSCTTPIFDVEFEGAIFPGKIYLQAVVKSYSCAIDVGSGNPLIQHIGWTDVEVRKRVRTGFWKVWYPYQVGGAFTSGTLQHLFGIFPTVQTATFTASLSSPNATEAFSIFTAQYWLFDQVHFRGLQTGSGNFFDYSLVPGTNVDASGDFPSTTNLPGGSIGCTID